MDKICLFWCSAIKKLLEMNNHSYDYGLHNLPKKSRWALWICALFILAIPGFIEHLTFYIQNGYFPSDVGLKMKRMFRLFPAPIVLINLILLIILCSIISFTSIGIIIKQLLKRDKITMQEHDILIPHYIWNIIPIFKTRLIPYSTIEHINVVKNTHGTKLVTIKVDNKNIIISKNLMGSPKLLSSLFLSLHGKCKKHGVKVF